MIRGFLLRSVRSVILLFLQKLRICWNDFS